MIDVVLDTNVLVAALRSQRGASSRLLRHELRAKRFRPHVSATLCLEYEAVLFRPGIAPGYSPAAIGDFLDDLLAFSSRHPVFYRWRPHLPDPGDDFVFEIALAAGVDLIVTHNVRHFTATGSMGIRAVTPDKFLGMLLPS